MLRACRDHLKVHNYLHHPASYIGYSDVMSVYTCRNPWTRAVSAYKYLENHNKIPPGYTFSRFVDTIPHTIEQARDDMEYMFVLPQHTYIESEKKIYHELRYETLALDFQEFLLRHSLPELQLCHLNASGASNHDQWYDDYTMNRITEIYKQDIERFKYTF